MCISILVYETVANVRRRLLIYFNKERRCPVYFNNQEIEWQIGDFREDGNAQVTEDSSQYGRSFTRSL